MQSKGGYGGSTQTRGSYAAGGAASNDYDRSGTGGILRCLVPVIQVNIQIRIAVVVIPVIALVAIHAVHLWKVSHFVDCP